MGFPVELLVDRPVDQEFICSICDDVLQDPVMVNSGCEHLFCRNCINQWNDKSPNQPNACPLDRKVVSDVIQPPRIVASLLNKRKLHCQFKNCVEITTYERILDHESKCKHNSDNYVNCTKGCEAKVWKADQETHQCLEYLKQQNEQLRIEVADLKVNYARVAPVAFGNNIVDLPAEPNKWKPGGIYAICIFVKPGGTSYLDLKLGDIIQIEKELFGQNCHMGIKNGVKGLVPAACVRILADELVKGFEMAQCIKPKSTTLHPSKGCIPYLATVQVICKDIELWYNFWIVNFNGRVGYVNPCHFDIF